MVCKPNSTQVTKLAWVLYSRNIRDAKAFLAKHEYTIDGINYSYRQVQGALDALYAINDAVKAGTLKATKRSGLQRVKTKK